MEIKPFERGTSISFLEEGFKAEKKEVSKEIERLVDFVDNFQPG